MRSYAVSLMGLVVISSAAVSATAWAYDQHPSDTTHGEGVTHGSSTYVPGPASGSRSVRAYSTRNSAVDLPRGGGPPDAASTLRESGRLTGSDVGTDADRINVHAAHGRAVSDNETRRPGAANYTGSSYRRHEKNDDGARVHEQRVGASAHGVPEPPGVSMVGDNFAAHTGSRVSGPIPVRVPESNERDTRAGWATQSDEPIWRTARGGGPGSFSLGTGAHDAPAPSHAFDYWHLDRVAQPGKSPLSSEDMRALPYRGDGTRRAGTGLLSPATPDRSTAVSQNPAPLSSSTWEMTRQGVVPGGADSAAPVSPTARGGGPRHHHH